MMGLFITLPIKLPLAEVLENSHKKPPVAKLEVEASKANTDLPPAPKLAATTARHAGVDPNLTWPKAEGPST